MIHENTCNALLERAKTFAHSSMNYIDFDDCKNAEVLYDRDDLILLRDTSKTPAMLYFATNDFASLVEIAAELLGALRMHFVPRAYAPQLEQLGFIEWGEYADFWNRDLAGTAARLDDIGTAEYLHLEECEAVSLLSQRCRLQSRGFEGESAAWFAQWLGENDVLIVREGSEIVGFCCVSIYNGGTTLWIREVAVDPVHQGKGFGKRLMEQAICYGVEKGAVKGFLAADVLNQNAIGLYAKYDFHAGEDRELQMIREGT